MSRLELDSLVESLFHSSNRNVAIVLIMYFFALASLVSYLYLNNGDGMPTRMQFLFLSVPVFLMFYLALQWKH
jgi:amino acid permease